MSFLEAAKPIVSLLERHSDSLNPVEQSFYSRMYRATQGSGAISWKQLEWLRRLETKYKGKHIENESWTEGKPNHLESTRDAVAQPVQSAKQRVGSREHKTASFMGSSRFSR